MKLIIGNKKFFKKVIIQKSEKFNLEIFIY